MVKYKLDWSDFMEELRERINIIDDSIRNLFLERMQVVKEVALYKKQNDLPVFDEEREKLILKRNIESIDDKDLADLFASFYKKMINVSKKYQERIMEK